MKKTWIAALALALFAVAAFSQAPSPAPLSNAALARILGEPAAATAACRTRTSGVTFAARNPLPSKSACTATANCESGTVGCSGNTSCSAYDRSCPGEPGHVVCDGTSHYCATECPPDDCTTGGPRQRACCRCAQTGDCLDCEFCDFGYYMIDYCP
jgi:hypothetical protein